MVVSANEISLEVLRIFVWGVSRCGSISCGVEWRAMTFLAVLQFDDVGFQ